MKKFLRVTESELTKIIREFLNEDSPVIPDLSQCPQNNIECIQSSLKDKGFGSFLGTTGPNKDGIDGIYGEKTKQAVIAFQKKNGIKQTGFVGVLTAPKLGCEPLKQSCLKPKTSEPKSTGTKEVAKKIEKIYDNNVPSPKITKEPDSSLYFNGKTLSWLSGGKTVKQWSAVSGRQPLPATNSPEQKDWVSGYGANPEYVKSPKEYSKIKSEGPLPEGSYTLGTVQTRTGEKAEKLINGVKNIWDLYKMRRENEDAGHDWNSGSVDDRIAWGDYRAPISPDKNTNTYGRGSFYVHGGGIAGSSGCIDLTNQMPDFAKYYTTWLARTGSKRIPLTVKYS
jgi:peptidoglycan hydrolase-like protein with peptidoglycan-binding domain